VYLVSFLSQDVLAALMFVMPVFVCAQAPARCCCSKSSLSRTSAHLQLILTVRAGDSKMLVFKVILSNPLGGAVLGKRAICRVIMVPGRSKLSKSKVEQRGQRRAVSHVLFPCWFYCAMGEMAVALPAAFLLGEVDVGQHKRQRCMSIFPHPPTPP